MKCKLGDIAFINMGQSPSSKCYNSDGNGVPFLQGNRTFGYLYPSIVTYTSEVTKLAEYGDILLSVRAPVGDLNIAPCKLCVGRGLCSLRSKNGNQFFLYYYLKQNIKFLIRQSNGTTFTSLTKDVLADFEIEIPPNINQGKISNVLFSLDEKINHNLEIKSILESLAKTIYDYWFLQFDFPNEEGKPYKSSGGAMVWNEELNMEIPKGWSVMQLGLATSLYLGGTPKTNISSYWNGDINWLNSGELAQFPVVETELKITKQGLENSATMLMKKGTVVISITGNIRASVLAIDSCGNQSIIGINENDTLKKSYVYPLIVHLLDYFTTISTGNCQQHINKDTLNKTYILMPPKEVLSKYYELVEPMFDSIINYGNESRCLRETRDFLLPLLMNGQVGFKDN